MRKLALITVLATSMVGVPMLAGCDRTVSEEKTSTSGPNGTKTTEQKTVQHPDGSTSSSSSSEKHTNNP